MGKVGVNVEVDKNIIFKLYVIIANQTRILSKSNGRTDKVM